MKTTKYVTQNELQEVFEILNGELWRKAYTSKNGRKWPRKLVKNVANLTDGYCQVGFKGQKLKYHRIIWTLIYGKIPDEMQIDHIDGNKINNNIKNLRLVTTRQNQQNQVIHRNGRLFGCRYHTYRCKWQARATIGGKSITIGYYNTEQEAHYAYKNFLLERGVA